MHFTEKWFCQSITTEIIWRDGKNIKIGGPFADNMPLTLSAEISIKSKLLKLLAEWKMTSFVNKKECVYIYIYKIFKTNEKYK